MKNSRFPSPALLRQHFHSPHRLRAALVLSLIALVSSLPFYSFAQGDGIPAGKSRPIYSVAPNKGSFVLYAGANGETLCRAATVSEAAAISGASSRGLVQINHLGKEESAESTNAGAQIVLFATDRLKEPANDPAEQAFIAAAAKWEALIKDPIVIAVEVDYGPDFFGTAYASPQTVGATQSTQYFRTGNYPAIRTSLMNRASSSTETAITSALPQTTLPTDFGPADTILATSPNLRALREMELDYRNDDPKFPITKPKIGFNSAFPFDFDPSNGISGGTDFDAVAVHELGHLLGFNSSVGDEELNPAGALQPTIWDLYRFKPGTANLNTFSTAQRILKRGVSPTDPHVQFNGGAELGLSTADGKGDGGDEEQASHWKADEQSGTYIGIMDPTIRANQREVMTTNDQNAIDFFGYLITDAPPGPPNDNFAAAQAITGTSGTINGTNAFATAEAGEPTHDPAGDPSGKSVWYRWTAPSSGTANLTTAGSNYDTLLAVYTGSSVNALTTIIKHDDVNPGVIRTSTVTFQAVSGTTYQIAVDGWNGDQGGIQLNFTLPGGGATPTPTPSPTPGGPNTVQFGTITPATEGDGTTAKALVTVTRIGTITGAASVNYATTDASASERSDYLAALGTLRFAANETSKTITVFVVNDSFGEGPETFNITLSSPVGCTLGSPLAAAVTINSDEPTSGVHSPNPVKDPTFSSDNFVRQHYTDFFNREADASGLNFWKNQIDECTTQDCRNIRRANVSAAFFVSGEFQQTGYLVYKTYQAAFNSGEFLLLRAFLPDTQEIGRGVIGGGDAQLEVNKVAFFNDFVQRPTFVVPANYPTTMSAAAFVDKLNANTIDPRNTGSGGVLTTDQRNALVAELTPNPSSTALRASVLRQVAENALFSTRQFNKAFVLMQYFGYLRRNPNDPPEFGLDFGGYNFWLGKLNSFNGNYISAQMVEAFITAGEYKLRFGPD